MPLRDDVFPEPPTADPPRPEPRPRRASLAATLARERATGRPQRLKGLLIALFFTGVGIGVGAIGPVNTYRCTRSLGTGAEDGTVNCTVSRRLLGVYTLHRETLSGVTAVDFEKQDRPIYNRGVTLMGFVLRLAVKDAAGHSIPLTRWDEQLDAKSDAVGADEDAIRRSIYDFLSDTSAREVSGWWAHSVPLVIASVPMLIGLLMLALAALSLFARPTEWIYARADEMAKAADERAAREREGSESAHEPQDQDDDHDDSDDTARRVPPAAAVRPGRDDGEKDKDEDDEK